MKIRKLLACFIVIIFLDSCVQQSEYDRVTTENENLKKQLDEIENGANRLYEQAKEFIKNNEFGKAEEKLNILFEKHGETEEAKQGRSLLVQINSKKIELAENTSWERALSINTTGLFENYISEYPNGKYVDLAKNKITDLIKANEQSEYENALNTTNASTLRDFIKKYPNHKSVSTFKRKLIQLEVDDIFGDRNTGKLPTSERSDYGYSASSSIEIENGTGCDLIVRYSGSDVRMIEIPAGSSRTINLTSGSYRIAASACGANYAGTESLQGSYTSKYYITKSRY